MTRARARHTDPSTSHNAAARIGDLTENQQAVLIVIRMWNRPLLDEELVRVYADYRRGVNLPKQSESGLRSRRSELARMDPPRVLAGEKKKMSTGGVGTTWYAAPPA